MNGCLWNHVELAPSGHRSCGTFLGGTQTTQGGRQWLTSNPSPGAGGTPFAVRYLWVVERLFSWLHGFRKLRFVTEKIEERQFAFFDLAPFLICLRLL
jgi:hypothetical protein